MKKGILLVLLLAFFANTVFAQQAQQDNQPKEIYVINKTNGRHLWWDIFGFAGPRYYELHTNSEFATDSLGEKLVIHEMNCSDPGSLKCRWGDIERSQYPIVFNGYTISCTTIEDLIDKMLNEIDRILYRTGQSTGVVSRKQLIREEDNRDTVLEISLTARWTNGNTNCDANITFEIDDVTEFVY